MRVKAVERNVETLDFSNVEAAKFLKPVPRRTSMGFGIFLGTGPSYILGDRPHESLIFQCFRDIGPAATP